MRFSLCSPGLFYAPVIAIASLIAMVPGVAHAMRDGATLSFMIENDSFAGTDQNYTNGFHATLLSGRDDVPEWFRDLAGTLPLIDADDTLRRGIGVGQSLFTPEETDLPFWPEGQQPYAGWLYASLMAVSEHGRLLNTAQLNVGVIGPAALGKQVQNNFHELIGVEESLGWDDQLKNEPGVELIFERKVRGWMHGEIAGLSVDLTPDVKLGLGNVSTFAGAGAVLRLGRDLGADFGPPRIRPGLSGAAFFDNPRKFNWYVFGGFEGRAVARNIFLDGNSFRDGPRVDRRVLTGETQAGIVFQFEHVQVAFTAVYRLREFQEQTGGHRFGALSLSRRF